MTNGLAVNDLKRFEMEKEAHANRFDGRTVEQYRAINEAIERDIERTGGKCHVFDCTLTNPKTGLPSQWRGVRAETGEIISAYNITDPCPPFWE